MHNMCLHILTYKYTYVYIYICIYPCSNFMPRVLYSTPHQWDQVGPIMCKSSIY